MLEIINSVKEKIRPPQDFACNNCPYSSWTAGVKKSYETRLEKSFEDDDYLDCYCNKKHTTTYDTTLFYDNRNQRLFYPKIIKICQDKLRIQD